MPPFITLPTPSSSGDAGSPTPTPAISASPAIHSSAHARPTKRLKLQVEVKAGDLCYPRSSHHGWQPPVTIHNETKVINEFGELWNSMDHQEDQYNIWALEEFTVYRNENTYRHAGELCCLQTLNVEKGVNELLLDGILTLNGRSRYIKGARFDCVSVEGYGDEHDTVSLYIQTILGAKANVWYRLGRPAQEYIRYFTPFKWLARFSKYFVEYLTEAEESISLANFRRTFYPFIESTYGSSSRFQHWFSMYGSEDFRQALCANVGFLWKECYSMDQDFLKHPIWHEVDPQKLKAIPMESSRYEKTVVTPFVYDMFHTMAFHSQLQVLEVTDPTIIEKRQNRRTDLGLTPFGCVQTRTPSMTQETVTQDTAKEIRQGDVVCVAAAKGGRWKTPEDARWYAFVQKVRTLKSGNIKLDVLWLYEPSDTTLGAGYYPYKNELFLSDNCSCHKEALNAEAVLAKVKVNWYAKNPADQKGCFFVRQKFRTEATFGAYDFVQLRQSDFHCGCEGSSSSEMAKVQEQFSIGDTVLIRQTLVNEECCETLEPAIISQFTAESVIVRKFLRAGRDLGELHAMPNQILLSTEEVQARPDDVVRRCRVKSFPSLKDVVSPFDRGGAGDFWIVIGPATTTWNQPDLKPSEPKLRGMGIFCGGGSFDRGLEEAGGVSFKYGVDWAQHALHTYRANLKDPEEMHLFLGSVNDYLAKAMLGSQDKRIANIGDVDMIAAGSPCPGFSPLQRDKSSNQSLRNCSLVASVCSYVDLFMPKYLVLENVLGMAQDSSKGKDQNVFSQVLCYLVASGYQVQQFLMEPGHYGSCQSRTRIFIVATAPGFTPLEEPPQTHACPELETYTRSIGTSSNGLRFGTRRHDVAPFRSVSAKQAFDGLPDISEDHVQTCVAFPDHRSPRHEEVDKRTLIASIPRWPHGQGFVQAVSAGRMPKKLIEQYRWENPFRASSTAKAWSRMYPNRLVGCILTGIRPHDSFGGRVLHWEQPRCMSVMEARRTQGFLDHEVIVGLPSHQWKIIGNSVDRKVAFALGLQLGEAVRQNEKDRRDVAGSSWSTMQVERSITTISRAKEMVIAQSNDHLPTPENTGSPSSKTSDDTGESRLIQGLLAERDSVPTGSKLMRSAACLQETRFRTRMRQ